jgi:hypothetical protein
MRRKFQPVGYFKAIAEIARIFAPNRFRKICKEAASSLTAARGEPDSSAGRHSRISQAASLILSFEV